MRQGEGAFVEETLEAGGGEGCGEKTEMAQPPGTAEVGDTAASLAREGPWPGLASTFL